jgi:hypothetical protein
VISRCPQLLQAQPTSNDIECSEETVVVAVMTRSNLITTNNVYELLVRRSSTTYYVMLVGRSSVEMLSIEVAMQWLSPMGEFLAEK